MARRSFEAFGWIMVLCLTALAVSMLFLATTLKPSGQFFVLSGILCATMSYICGGTDRQRRKGYIASVLALASGFALLFVNRLLG